MSRYVNKDNPYFNNTTGEILAFGVVYFGDPNTDPMDQDNNAKAPFADRELSTPADSVQTLTIGGKLQQRLYLDGVYAITVTDADGNVIDTDPYYVGESTDQIVNDSDVPGATLTAALNTLLARIEALETNAVDLDTVFRIGGIYLTTTNEHPGSYAGFGTWEALGAGRVLVGVGSGTDENGTVQSFTAGATGGEYSTELVTANLPEHQHLLFGTTQGSGSATQVGADQTASVDWQNYTETPSYRVVSVSGDALYGLSGGTGDGTAHNNVQPWLAAYFWKRIA